MNHTPFFVTVAAPVLHVTSRSSVAATPFSALAGATNGVAPITAAPAQRSLAGGGAMLITKLPVAVPVVLKEPMRIE